MPLGFDRLNERTQRPNARINFIKPLPTHSASNQEIAKDFLERIAAQCFRVMKQHHLSVMSLEEFPYNREFLGRNFNAGEVIQLVLKDRNGNWLSFKFVQMVMMHELAHCKQMNHSRFFWKERNLYADQMRDLWKDGYTGEGLWGKGKALASGQTVRDGMPEKGDMPEHLCGGTYRRARGRKRKRHGEQGNSREQPKMSYAERQQRRIAKKFCVHGRGNTLGEDELVRGGQEQKQRQQGKPRVAQSKRGRELRATAALARFENAHKQSQLEDDPSSDEAWSDYEDDVLLGAGHVKTVDVEDEKGMIQMVQVCGDEGDREEDGGRIEMEELRMTGMDDDSDTMNLALSQKVEKKSSQKIRSGSITEHEKAAETDRGSSQVPVQSFVTAPTVHNPGVVTRAKPHLQLDDVGNRPRRSDPLARASERYSPSTSSSITGKGRQAYVYQSSPTGELSSPLVSNQYPLVTLPTGQTENLSITCPICSLENVLTAATCTMCSHVLTPNVLRGHWRCQSHACRETEYINSGDVRRCGVCGEPKQTIDDMQDLRKRPSGIVGADILRWD
nr:dna-dependent metalloprotease wss1 like [Quercus suber]